MNTKTNYCISIQKAHSIGCHLYLLRTHLQPKYHKIILPLCVVSKVMMKRKHNEFTIGA